MLKSLHINKSKLIIVILSLAFTVLSFTPQIVDLVTPIPQNRAFELVHNYLFDYNFYLSRIREGMEGRFLVSEKYYNHPHTPSLFQVIYLVFGKVMGPFGFSTTFIYHFMRFLFGFILLVLTGFWAVEILGGFWGIVAFLLATTSGSWPIIIKLPETGIIRSATFMGWWSAIDSLQRITFLPHVLFGQITLLVFIKRFSKSFNLWKFKTLLLWGLFGCVAGIVFPPTLIIMFVFFGVISFVEVLQILIHGGMTNLKSNEGKKWIHNKLIPRLFFSVLSIPSIAYMQIMFKEAPWSALPLFDIQHRIPLYYDQYINAMGPVVPLGIAGLVFILIGRNKKYIPFIIWVLSLIFLFKIFERVPQQSPLRFTEGAIHIPLGIFAAYLFYILWNFAKKLPQLYGKILKTMVSTVLVVELLASLFVMWSMIGWLTDQVYTKRVGTWLVPLGVQLIFPLNDFMDAVKHIGKTTNRNDVVLTYITAGNYIPAYAGNYVYIGHANTPDEDGKEKIAADFFAGRMTDSQARLFIQKERVKYIYFGPQEKEIGGWKITDFASIYKTLSLEVFYKNNQVVVYKVR